MDALPRNWQDSFQIGLSYTMTQLLLVLPRILGAIIVFIVGLLLARILRRLVVKMLEALRVSKVIEKTPLELFLKNAEVGQHIEEVIGSLVYGLFVFVALYVTVSMLGLSSLSQFMDQILAYIPHIFSALLIFLFGILLAGIVESIVKGGLRSVDIYSARLFAKVASYAVVTFAGLAAVAELGIASEFIKILFAGVVCAFALGSGLAIGLGGQHTVKKIMDDWYQRTR